MQGEAACGAARVGGLRLRLLRGGLSAAAAAAGAEVIQVSSTGAGSGAVPLDRARIDKIREAIRNNSYPIDYDALADRMIEADLSRYDEQ